MQVGTVATVVEVVSDAEALLATTSSAIGDVLPEFEVTSLPLETTHAYACVYCKHLLAFAYDGQAAQDPCSRLS